MRKIFLMFLILFGLSVQAEAQVTAVTVTGPVSVCGNSGNSIAVTFTVTQAADFNPVSYDILFSAATTATTGAYSSFLGRAMVCSSTDTGYFFNNVGQTSNTIVKMVPVPNGFGGNIIVIAKSNTVYLSCSDPSNFVAFANPCATATPTNTNTATRTPTNSPTNTLTNSPTATMTQGSFTNTPTNTNTNTATKTPTPTLTNSPTKTPTNSPTATYNLTNTITATPFLTDTRTPTFTFTPTNTLPAGTNTFTPLATLTFTSTAALTDTPVPTNTPTFTPTPELHVIVDNPVYLKSDAIPAIMGLTFSAPNSVVIDLGKIKARTIGCNHYCNSVLPTVFTGRISYSTDGIFWALQTTLSAGLINAGPQGSTSSSVWCRYIRVECSVFTSLGGPNFIDVFPNTLLSTY